MPISKKEAPKVLPNEAKDIYVSAWNGAYDGTCKEKEDRDECSSKIAWTAVKKQYKKAGDKWVPKSIPVTELSLYISKASLNKKTQQMRGVAVASDTDEDSYGDNMSLELYQDFIGRIEKGEPAPEKFRSEFWEGGMPYLSISHYSDQNGEAAPGDIESIYMDGNRLKQKFTLKNNKIGKAIFDAICDDLYSENPEYEDPIRLSIGFIDWKHKHKDTGYVFERESLSDICPQCLSEAERSGKIYLLGQLIHSAFTRVPVNSRTKIEKLEERSMSEIKTRMDDAASIVGEDEAKKLEEQELVGKSEALVVKSEDEEEEDETEEEDDAEKKENGKKKKDEEEKVKKSAGSSEVEEKAMYGPTSIAELKNKREAIEQINEMAEYWEMLSQVVYNIFSSPDVEDKKSAIGTAVKEFRNMLTSKSMLVEEHKLGDAWKAFSSVYNELPEEATKEDKLRAIQPAFETLGEAIVESVEGEQEVVEDEQVVEENGDINLESLVAALQKANEPLLQKLSLIETSLVENAKTRTAVPARRSISPNLVKQSLPANTEENKAKVSPLSQLINKSVGLDPNHVRPGAKLNEEK